jgi:hypothetical protein
MWKKQSNEDFKATVPSTDYDISQKLENVEYFNYLCSVIINDATCAREVKSRLAKAKSAFNKKKVLFAGKLDLNLGKKLVKCYIWSLALYGA